MALYDYSGALKQGRRRYQESVLTGKHPYLPVLDEVLSYTEIVAEVSLGVMDIPLDKIVGTRTSGRTNAFANNFMPLLPEKLSGVTATSSGMASASSDSTSRCSTTSLSVWETWKSRIRAVRYTQVRQLPHVRLTQLRQLTLRHTQIRPHQPVRLTPLRHPAVRLTPPRQPTAGRTPTLPHHANLLSRPHSVHRHRTAQHPGTDKQKTGNAL